jgi:hypothetical protein
MKQFVKIKGDDSLTSLCVFTITSFYFKKQNTTKWRVENFVQFSVCLFEEIASLVVKTA